MKVKKIILAVIATMCFINVTAQKLTGSLSFLSEEEKINVVFDYSAVLIQGIPEKETYEIKGETWATQWEEAKTATFYPQFIDHLNKNLNSGTKLLLCGDYPDANYQMTVKILTFGRVWGIECEIIFTKIGDETPLATVNSLKGDSKRWGGMGGFGSNTYLAGSAFSYAGQNFGKFLSKKY
jgi:hypothetical protein